MKPTSVFKWLILTFVLMTIPFICIEYINVAVSAPLLKNNIKLALNSSCRYFSAETYGSTTSGSGQRYNMPDLNNTNTGGFVSGKFYGSNTTADAIYNYVITDFKSKLVGKGIPVKTYSVDYTTGTTIYSDVISGINNFRSNSKYYSENKITPGNLGVSYLHKDVVEKMFRYNLANMLIDGNIDNIKKENGETYAKFNGFEVCIDSVYIDVRYFITVNDSYYFKTVSNLDYSNMGMNDYYTIVTEISYQIPVEYKGITPIKKAMEWIWKKDRRVSGVNNQNNSGYIEHNLNLNQTSYINSNASGLYLLNKIYYTIVD